MYTVIQNTEMSQLIEACISTDNMTVLEFVLTNAHYEDSEAIRSNQLSLLHEASIQGHTHAVRYLIKKGHDINAKDKIGRTSLMFASHQGHIETVQVLLATGAEVSTMDNLGDSALILAAQNGNTQIVQALIDAASRDNAKHLKRVISLLRLH